MKDKTEILVLASSTNRVLKSLEILREVVNISFANTIEDCMPLISTAEIILAWAGDCELLKPLFPHASSLKWIQSGSAGLDTLLFPELVNSQVVVTNCRGLYAEPLAEFVIAGALYFEKNIPRLLREQAENKWERHITGELNGKTMAIFGYGGIGKATARLAKSFGMKVLANKRHFEIGMTDPNVDQFLDSNSIPELCARADFLVISSPLTAETRGVINRECLNSLKKTSVLINVGRGEVIAEDVLIGLLSQNAIKGAVLDVTAEEPLPQGHAFFRLPNVLLSPHSADRTERFMENAAELFIENVRRYIGGDGLLNLTNKNLGY